MADDDDDDDGDDGGGVAKRIAERLRAGAGAPIPTSTFGRFRRTATTAMRAGAGALVSRVAGRTEVLDEEAIARLVASLGELKGVAMKVGQIMSYVDVPVPSPVRRQLAILRVHSQPTPFEKIERTLRADLPVERAEELLARIERAPAATASIGQVHRGVLPDGTRVAVKVLHPNIADAVRADFRGASVGKRIAKLVMPGADIGSIIAEAESALLEECDYGLEARNQALFGELFAPSAGAAAAAANTSEPGGHITVPAVHAAWCSARVLTTTWHDGLDMAAFTARRDAAALDRAGVALFTFYVGSFYRHALFNADPHPGNLLFDGDGGVVFLDYGCVRRYRPAMVRAMAALSRAARAGDDDALLAAFAGLGARAPSSPAERDVALRLVRGFYAPVIAPGVRAIEVGFSRALREIMDDKRALLRLQLPGELLFLIRIRFGVYSVLARLGARADWNALEARFADDARSL